MCQAQRPRFCDHNKTKQKQSTLRDIIDLTNNSNSISSTRKNDGNSMISKSTDNNNIRIASTDSARMKRKKRKANANATSTKHAIIHDVIMVNDIDSDDRSETSNHAVSLTIKKSSQKKLKLDQPIEDSKTTLSIENLHNHKRNNNQSKRSDQCIQDNMTEKKSNQSSIYYYEQSSDSDKEKSSSFLLRNNKKNKSSNNAVQRTIFGTVVESNDTISKEKQKTKVNKGKTESQPSSSSLSIPTHKEKDPVMYFRKQPLSYEQLYEKALYNLQSIFKITSLRNLQPIAIQSVLQKKSQIIVMATGGGKSLCYQLPATVLDGVAIVVSPLIALMEDQVYNLKEKGIEAINLSSVNSAKVNNSNLKRLLGEDNITKTNGSKKSNRKEKDNTIQKPIKLVYCTPEFIQTDRGRRVLGTLYERNQISLIAIDEAHCLSTWGHDFRPAYRKLSYLRISFPDIPLMVSFSFFLCWTEYTVKTRLLC